MYGKLIFKDLSNPGQGLSKYLCRDHFEMHELTEIMRQKDDLRFAELLNRLGESKLTLEDKEDNSQKMITPQSLTYLKHALNLFIENKSVDAFNENLLDSMTTQKAIVKADPDTLLQIKPSNKMKWRRIQNLPENQANTRNFKAVYMIHDISLNIDVGDELTNGATSVEKHIEYRTTS